MTLPQSDRQSGPFTLSADQVGPHPFAWWLPHADDLTVLRFRNGVETTLAYGADYTIAGIGNPAGGSITLSSALAGDQIVCLGDKDITRGANFSPGWSTTPDLLNVEGDKVFLHLQEIKRDLAGALKSDIFNPANFNAQDRRIANVADPVNAKDAANKGWVESTTAASAAAAAAAASAAATSAGAASASASAAFQSAAAAEAAAQVAQGGILPFDTRAALKAIDSGAYKNAYLREAGRQGVWLWRAGDFSAQIAADTAEGCYMKADAVAAGVGAWVRQFDGPVLASWFGAVGAVGTNDGAALLAWLRFIIENNREGRLDKEYYETNSALAYLPVGSERVFSIEGRATIKYTGSSPINRLLYVNGSVKAFKIDGPLFDGNNKAATGVSVVSSYGLARLVSQNVRVANTRIVNDAAINAHAAGISLLIGTDVTPHGGYGEITRCSVTSMTKDEGVGPAALANQALILVGFEQALMARNKVDGVYSESVTTVDADGGVVYSRRIGGVYQRMNGLIEHNVFKNCVSRFIKLQTVGEVVTRRNRGIIDAPALKLGDQWRGIDSQIGDCYILDNTMQLSDDFVCVAPHPIYMQTAASVSLTGRVERIARGNVIETGKTLYEGIALGFLSTTNDNYFEVRENRWRYSGGTPGTPSCNIAVNMIFPSSDLSAATRYEVVLDDNEVDNCNNFILSIKSGAASDVTGKVGLVITRNRSKAGNAILLRASTANVYTSDMLIAGNQIGPNTNLAGNRLQQAALDLSKLRPGCSFDMGTGTIANGPAASLSGSAIQKPSTRHMSTYVKTSLKHTDDNGATWATALLS